MDKLMEEEDLKGLEEEIDDAVERLFVEKKGGGTEKFLMDSEISEPPVKSPVLEPTMGHSPLPPPTDSPMLEIDDAVERLFVEKKGGGVESFLMEPELSEPALKPSDLEPAMEPPHLERLTESPILETPVASSLLEPSYELEKVFEGAGKAFESEISIRPPSTPVPFLKSIEQLEAQLLSLEWEISEDKLRKTKKEVLVLRELIKERADIASILTSMEKALSDMIQDERNIRPLWIKFLLDSKDTIKLLMKKEKEGEINIYKQLAYLGIEARFSCLGKTQETPMLRTRPGEEKTIEKAEISVAGEKKIDDMSNRMNRFMERAEEIFRTMKQEISRLEETTRKPRALDVEDKSKRVNVTIVKVDEKLFGIETEKVCKLFRVPNTFYEKYSDQEKVRLRDLEVRMINLKKILSMPGGGDTGSTRILTVKENGEYKGLMVDQVLRRLSTTSEVGGGYGEFFSGRINFTYDEQPVEVPILDLKKF